jgi:hypothetical protein
MYEHVNGRTIFLWTCRNAFHPLSKFAVTTSTGKFNIDNYGAKTLPLDIFREPLIDLFLYSTQLTLESGRREQNDRKLSVPRSQDTLLYRELLWMITICSDPQFHNRKCLSCKFFVFIRESSGHFSRAPAGRDHSKNQNYQVFFIHSLPSSTFSTLPYRFRLRKPQSSQFSLSALPIFTTPRLPTFN